MIFLLLPCILASCTLNMIQTSTVGSKDQVSTDPETQLETDPNLNIPAR